MQHIYNWSYMSAGLSRSLGLLREHEQRRDAFNFAICGLHVTMIKYSMVQMIDLEEAINNLTSLAMSCHKQN